MTTSPATNEAVVLDALPAPCCAHGRDLVANTVREMIKDWKSGGALAAQTVYAAHMIQAHRVTGHPQRDCPWCQDWVAMLELSPGTDPDLNTALGTEAAGHFVRHWILDPVAVALGYGTVATLTKGDDEPAP